MKIAFRAPNSAVPFGLLRRHEEFGIEELDIVRAPQRFWSDAVAAPPVAQLGVDPRHIEAHESPAVLLAGTHVDEVAIGTPASLARLFAYFLVIEDKQRRLERREVVTLAHQASVVRHIAERPLLRRVLLADEVGLGKTIEAGLLIRDLCDTNAAARVLYLAPARLVSNVRGELAKLGLHFRSLVAGQERDASVVSDRLIVASIHRASLEVRTKELLAAPPWDMIIVDECHHLSAWAPGGGSPVAQYRLIHQLAAALGDHGRLLLMSGTPHQGHQERFKNLLTLLRKKGEGDEVLAGRVIYRTKDDVRDWHGEPLFPRRQVNQPFVIDLGDEHQEWLELIRALFEPERASKDSTAQRRALGWRAGQALQWATSSVQAGIGYLVRQALRAGLTLAGLPNLRDALTELRPYRMGEFDEPIERLFERIAKEVGRQVDDQGEFEDIDDDEADSTFRPDPETLSALLRMGIDLLRAQGDLKWQRIWDQLIEPAGSEKVVLFAQPIETVTAVVDFLERKTGRRPAVIIGAQGPGERDAEVKKFWDHKGPQFLVSSRAGGEGINLQVARRLVHLDVPWNPMELEQRIGRVHRFKSRKTVLIDTVVVKNSREEVTYAYARQRLRLIAGTLATAENFDALFGRVMSLVPPEELQTVMAGSAAGPLSTEDQTRLSELVNAGFREWQTFHDQYAKSRDSITALDAGEATWTDLERFAHQHLDAQRGEAFSTLRFRFVSGEVEEARESAHVLLLRVDGAQMPFACGDYAGMPVQRDDGTEAKLLGTNEPAVAEKLRAVAFDRTTTGAASLKWPAGFARPEVAADGRPFGVLGCARQVVRADQGRFLEEAVELHVWVVTADGVAHGVAGQRKGDLVRALLQSSPHASVAKDTALGSHLCMREDELVTELRRPSHVAEQRRNHVVTPLIAAIVT